MSEAPQTQTDNRGINTLPLQPTPHPNKPRLCIITAIESGTSLSSLRHELDMKESAFQYHLSILKKQGCIRKVGYGTWELIDQPNSAKKRTTVSSHVGRDNTPTSRGSNCSSTVVMQQSQLQEFIPDAIRAHAFVFTLHVPVGLRNWDNEKRTEYLVKRGIPFKQLNIGGGGQRILVKEKKVWLLNKSIIIYDKASYFADDALQAKGTALAVHISIVRHIERLLHVSFQIGDDHKFKVSRQHYAMIQNALAKQYNEEGKKLEIRNGRGLWFLIDNSFNLNEAEAVHPSSAMSDTKKVQDWFNGLKEQPITPGFVLEVMAGIQANQMAFAENMSSHIEAVQALGSGVSDMTDVIRRLQQ